MADHLNLFVSVGMTCRGYDSSVDYADSEPGSPKSRFSSTTLSRDSGLMLNDTIFDDSAPESEVSTTPSSHAILSRSVSHMEDPTQYSLPGSEEPIILSQSYGHIERISRGPAPRKPPRRSKRRESVPQTVPTINTGANCGLSRTHAFRNDSVHQNFHRQANTNIRYNHVMHRSTDSLNSMGIGCDDSTDRASMGFPQDNQEVPEMAVVLRRSESGKHLNLNGELFPTTRTDDMHHTSSDKSSSDDTNVHDRHRSDNIHSDVSAIDVSQTQTSPIHSTPVSAAVIPEPYQFVPEVSGDTVEQISPSPNFSCVHLTVKNGKTLSTSMDQSFYQHHHTENQLGVGSPPPKVLLRHALDPNFRHMRRGMTNKGSDMFPKNVHSIKNSMHEDDIKKVSTEIQKKCPVSMHVTQKTNPTEPPTGVTRSSPSRPQRPPSYQEAMNRKSLLKSGAPVYYVSEADIVQQSVNSARARELYEKSMQQYMEQDVPKKQQYMEQDVPKKQPTRVVLRQTYTQIDADNNDTDFKEHSSQGNNYYNENKHKQEFMNTFTCNKSLDSLHRFNSISSSGSNNSDVHSRKNSFNHQHTHHRHQRENRVRRDRRGHRNSDTKLQDKAQKNRNNVNLSRSKSDSSEHINKIKFNELKAMENKGLLEIQNRPKYDIISTEKNLSDLWGNRKGIASVRNRDWHKDLAEKYSHVFYEPTVSLAETQYAYVKSTKQQNVDGTETKRRWKPPVHPTKDLVVLSENKNSRAKNTNNKRFMSQQRQASDNQKSSVVKPEVCYIEQCSTVRQMPRQTSMLPSKSVSTTACDAPEELDNINWSVSELRSLYDKAPRQPAKGVESYV